MLVYFHNFLPRCFILFLSSVFLMSDAGAFSGALLFAFFLGLTILPAQPMDSSRIIFDPLLLVLSSFG